MTLILTKTFLHSISARENYYVEVYYLFLS